MLQPDPQDDVSRLCRSVHMDPSAYLRFEMPQMAAAECPAAADEPVPTADTSVDAGLGVKAEPRAASHPAPVSEPAELTPAPQPLPVSPAPITDSRAIPPPRFEVAARRSTS